MSFTRAAYQVLKSVNCPLHVTEILERAMQEGLLKTKGKTPKGTMSASLYLENVRRQKRGEKARFVQHGNNVWGLAERKTKQE